MIAGSVPSVGDEWPLASIVWGKRCGHGKIVEQRSPIDGSLVQNTRLLSDEEVLSLLQPSRNDPSDGRPNMDLFCRQLTDHLRALHPQILHATQLETGFTASDCEEVVAASIEYAEGFASHSAGTLQAAPDPIHYVHGSSGRSIELTTVPWGTVVAILPQSAFLILAVTCILNGLYEGNRVIVRAPAQSARSAALLGMAIEASAAFSSDVSIVLASASDFLDAVCRSGTPGLVHYLGSSTHAVDVMAKCFDAGMHSIIDGEGNVWVYVDSDADPDLAAGILVDGSLRYNGQTCTSVNGAIVHPEVYAQVKERLAQRWDTVKYGNPLTADVMVGPVLDADQASTILDRIATSGANVIAGGTASGSLLTPTLAAEPDQTSRLVTEGLFGPALWIAPGTFDAFREMWQHNRYPLCAGIISSRLSPREIASALPNLARISFNGDPSIEHIYEPWGGYPATGNNPVSDWRSKYRRLVQIDRAVQR